MNATTKKLRDIRRLMRRKQTFGEIAEACGVPLHEVGWCYWLRAYALRDAASRLQEVRQRVTA